MKPSEQPRPWPPEDWPRDSITEPQEWIDSLVSEYSPNANDIDVALQNMGLKIKELSAALTQSQAELAEAQKMVEQFRSGIADPIPTSWLDPLLTGPNAVISQGPYTQTDIERLLNAIRKRIWEPTHE